MGQDPVSAAEAGDPLSWAQFGAKVRESQSDLLGLLSALLPLDAARMLEWRIWTAFQGLTIGDAHHLFFYAQRTPDGRIAIGWLIVVKLFEFEWLPDWTMVLGTLGLGLALVIAFALAASLPLLRAKPAQALREL